MNAELCNDAGELIGNPNVLVNIVSTRVRQLNNGDRPLLDSPLLGAAAGVPVPPVFPMRDWALRRVTAAKVRRALRGAMATWHAAPKRSAAVRAAWPLIWRSGFMGN